MPCGICMLVDTRWVKEGQSWLRACCLPLAGLQVCLATAGFISTSTKDLNSGPQACGASAGFSSAPRVRV